MNEKEILDKIKIKNLEILNFKKDLNKIREDNKTIEDIQKESLQRQKTFNGMTAKEWTISSRSVWNDVSSQRKKEHLNHGATFPEKLAERVITMYSKKGDLIFDPFLGTGTTLFASKNLNRTFIGIELNGDFIKYINLKLNNLFEISYSNFIIEGNCLEKIKEIDDETIQLTFTSPPYANLLRQVEDDRTNRHKSSRIVKENNSTSKPYSDNKLDFGNMNIEEYSNSVLKLMKKIYKKTKKGGYNIWVVKDFRNVKNKIPYVDLHGLIANLGERAGFKYHDLIIWDQNEQRSLVLLGYPSVFYVNQNHSYLVVLRK